MRRARAKLANTCYYSLQLQNLVQFNCILRMRQNRKNWTREEDQTIISLVRKYGTKRWTLISQKMKQRYPDDGRSGKQCRERWHNHLSPIISKQPWTEQQIKMVFDSHRKFGNKWTQIAQLLPGRTDNAVKNQFYSTLRKGLRRICKILGTRNSTSRIKKIKPTVLSSLISSFTEIPLNQFDNQHELYEMLFQFSTGDKYEQLKQKEVSEANKQKMERLLEKILDSKEIGRKKRNRGAARANKPKIAQKVQVEKLEKKENILIEFAENIQKQKSKSNSKNKSISKSKSMKEESEEDKFNFNINLDELQQEMKKQKKSYYSFEIPHHDLHHEPLHTEVHQDEFDQRLEMPISLKRDNSLAQSFKDQQNLPSLKKRFSDSEKFHKRHQIQSENTQNLFACFLSKSPNFSSRIRMPTPRIHENYHNPFFSHHDNDMKEEDAEKFCNNVVQQLKTRVQLKKQKQERIR